MSTLTGKRISVAADKLCLAILEHARLCEDDPKNTQTIAPLIFQMRDLVRAYGDALLDGAGWSNPLHGIEPADPESESSEEGSNNQENFIPEGRTWVDVMDSQALFINDPIALVKYAEERLQRPVGGLADALLGLCTADGWKAEFYPNGIVEIDWRSMDVCEG